MVSPFLCADISNIYEGSVYIHVNVVSLFYVQMYITYKKEDCRSKCISVGFFWGINVSIAAVADSTFYFLNSKLLFAFQTIE